MSVQCKSENVTIQAVTEVKDKRRRAGCIGSHCLWWKLSHGCIGSGNYRCPLG